MGEIWPLWARRQCLDGVSHEVLCLLANAANKQGFGYISLDKLHLRSGLSHGWIITAIKSLEAEGYLEYKVSAKMTPKGQDLMRRERITYRLRRSES